MRRDDYIDFHYVQPEHFAIHEKLNDWARWVVPRASGWHVQPMFRMYRPYLWPRESSGVVLDLKAVLAMERSVSGLPDKHRTAVRWAYCFRWTKPNKMARQLAVSHRDLAELVRVGRVMLINSGVLIDKRACTS